MILFLVSLLATDTSRSAVVAGADDGLEDYQVDACASLVKIFKKIMYTFFYLH